VSAIHSSGSIGYDGVFAANGYWAADCCNSLDHCINKRRGAPTPAQPPIH